MTLYAWPAATSYGRVVPKNRILQLAKAGAALKAHFVRDVEQIVWACKLAPETLNLAATRAVAEIQVLRIRQKRAELHADVLQSIERVIPFPLIFELAHDGRVRTVAAYKRPSEADRTHWVVSRHFYGGWQAEAAPRTPLPLTLDLAALYEHLLRPLLDEQFEALTGALPSREMPAAYTVGASDAGRLSLEQRIALADAIAAGVKAVQRIEARLAREKQFNKRVAINAELRDAKQQLQQLIAQQAAAANP